MENILPTLFLVMFWNFDHRSLIGRHLFFCSFLGRHLQIFKNSLRKIIGSMAQRTLFFHRKKVPLAQIITFFGHLDPGCYVLKTLRRLMENTHVMFCMFFFGHVLEFWL